MKQKKLLFSLLGICLFFVLSSCSEEDKSMFGDDFEIPELTDANTIQFTVNINSDWKLLQIIGGGGRMAIEWGDGRLQKVENPDKVDVVYRYGNKRNYRVRIWAEELDYCNVGNGLVALSDLRIGRLPKMKNLTLNSFTDTKSLDIGTSCPNLEQANIGNFPDLESANWQGCVQLKKLHLYTHPNLATLRFENLPNLKELYYNGNGQTTLTISGLPSLKGMDCSGCGLESLVLKDLPNLALIRCADNKFTTLSLKGLPSLVSLNCSNNPQLSMLEFDDNSKMSDLSMATCAFRSIDFLSKLPQLVNFYCSFNQLTRLELSTNEKLMSLVCSQNQLESLLLPKPNYLRELFCFSNRLSATVLNTIFGQLNHYQPGSPNAAVLSFYDNPGEKGCDLSILNNMGWKILEK